MTEITQELIEQALERPDSFGYSGDLDLFNTWGLCGPGMHRDSDPLQESNYETITHDLETRFPNDVEVVSSSHWLVGWSDQLAVRVINEDGSPTDAFVALIEWTDALSEYPVADEMDFSRREHEALLETIENCYWPGNFFERGGTEYEVADDVPDTWVEDVARHLFDAYSISNAEDGINLEWVEDFFIEKGWVTEQDDIF